MILFVEDMLMIHSVRSALSLLVLLLVSGGCLAQVQTGTPAFGSFAGGPDVINLANLNSHIDIPILAKPGRGMSFNYDLVYDSSVWYPVKSGSTTTWQPVFNWGWVAQTAVATVYISYPMAMLNCDTPHRSINTISSTTGSTMTRGAVVTNSMERWSMTPPIVTTATNSASAPRP